MQWGQYMGALPRNHLFSLAKNQATRPNSFIEHTTLQLTTVAASWGSRRRTLSPISNESPPKSSKTLCIITHHGASIFWVQAPQRLLFFNLEGGQQRAQRVLCGRTQMRARSVDWRAKSGSMMGAQAHSNAASIAPQAALHWCPAPKPAQSVRPNRTTSHQTVGWQAGPQSLEAPAPAGGWAPLRGCRAPPAKYPSAA